MSSRKEDLYIFVENDSYRRSKSNVLESEAGLLKIMKHMQNLKILARQKADLKTELHNLFDMMVGELSLMEMNLPKPILPKEIQYGEAVEDIHPPISKEKTSLKRDAIDEELIEIQEKLRILNSY